MTHEYLPGHCAGAETMLHGMLRALAGAGHEVDVTLSLQTGEPYDLDGIRVRPRQSKKVHWICCWPEMVIAHLANTPPARLWASGTANRSSSCPTTTSAPTTRRPWPPKAGSH